VRRGRRGAVREFWSRVGRDGAPLLERDPASRHHYWVTFLWRANRGAANVGVRSMSVGDQATETQLLHLAGTDVWYRTYRARDDLREIYQFALHEPKRRSASFEEEFGWIKRRVPDPLNPKRIRYPPDPDLPGDFMKYDYSDSSLLELPRAPQHPELAPRRGIEAGRLDRHLLSSRILKERRRIWVHIPAGVRPDEPGVRLAIFFDGFTYAHSMASTVVLDNLVGSGRIAPVLSVFVDQLGTMNERMRDLCNLSPAFGEFLLREVLPWVERTYHLRPQRDRTLLAGLSCGGLSALYWAVKHPGHFRLVLSQSGSFQRAISPEEEPGSLIRLIMRRPRLPLRIYMDVGLNEGNYVMPDGMTLLAANRHLRDVLQLKGYRPTYREFNGGHDFQNWRHTLVDGLVDLLGTSRGRKSG
jgi:enterochelin esterase-like enzyme